MTTDGAPREAYADPDFVIVRMTAVRALGSWEAAGCFQRIAWRCERDGQWTATMAEIAEEIGVSVRTAKRITAHLRDLGWVESERENPSVSTLTWRVRWAEGQPGTPEEANLALTPEGQTGTDSVTSESAKLALAPEEAKVAPREGQTGTDVKAKVALTPTSKTGKTRETPTASQSDAKTARGTRLPDGWQPDERLRQWFREQPFSRTINPLIETEKFIDFWRAKSGKDATKLDWPATWRNWMRNAAGYQGDSTVRTLANRHHAPDSEDRRQRTADLWG